MGGSTQRETSAERWAEAHRPSTPHTTATWTSGGMQTLLLVYVSRRVYYTIYQRVDVHYMHMHMHMHTHTHMHNMHMHMHMHVWV